MKHLLMIVFVCSMMFQITVAADYEAMITWKVVDDETGMPMVNVEIESSYSEIAYGPYGAHGGESKK